MSAPPPELVSASPAGSTAFAEPKPLQGSHARFGVADGGSARSFTSSNGTDGDQPSPGSGSTFDGTNDAVKERARRAITGLSNSSAKIKDLLPGRRGKDRKRGKESFVGEDGGPTADSSQQRSFSLSSAFSATTDAHGRRRTESEASIDGENTLHPTLSQHADLMEASDVEYDETPALTPTPSESLTKSTHLTDDIGQQQTKSSSPVRKLRGSLRRKKNPDTQSPALHQYDSDATESALPSPRRVDPSLSTSSSTLISIPSTTATSSGKNNDPPNQPTTPRIIMNSDPSTPPLRETPATCVVTPPTPTDIRESVKYSQVSDVGDHTSDSSQSQRSLVDGPDAEGHGQHDENSSSRRSGLSASSRGRASSIANGPLSPTIEEANTPGGTLVSPAMNSGGFFSSVISAAQSAASQLTSITVPSATPSMIARDRSLSRPDAADNEIAARIDEGNGGGTLHPHKELGQDSYRSEKRKSAIETLGSGDLTLDHLGISQDDSDQAPPRQKADESSNAPGVPARDGAGSEERISSRAMLAAIADKNGIRARSPSRPPYGSAAHVSSPPKNQLADQEQSSMKRSGSLRSKISAGRRQRNRGNSTATRGSNNTISGLGGQRLTGFAVASSKRNRDFHQLFKSVPEDDFLIDDYSAALQKEILLHGRLYVSERHICFSSNILGWVTTLVVSFEEVVSVEKKSTAVIFPNAIIIQTLHARNIFASFISRDTTYDLLVSIWKTSRPNLKSSLNGVVIEDAGTGDKTVLAESVDSDGGTDDDFDDDVYDEDADEEEANGTINGVEEAGAVLQDNGWRKSGTRKTSAATAASTATNGILQMAEAIAPLPEEATVSPDYPGPASHAPTECGDDSSHYDKTVLDSTIASPLGKVYSTMFGQDSGAFMQKWLIDMMKSTDLQYVNDKRGLGPDVKTFNYSYVKPLGGSIGPRQTRCIITQTLEQFDLDRVVSVDCSTQNPDVPSGNSFVVKTRYCLMWAPANSTRIIMTCTVEWTGKSWIKGAIEKGASDGQQSYARDLITGLHNTLISRPRSVSAGQVAPKMRSKNRKSEASESKSVENQIAETIENAQKPLPEAPAAPMSTSTFRASQLVNLGSVGLSRTAIGVGAIVLALAWFRSGRLSNDAASVHRNLASEVSDFPSALRIAAYEEIWKHEESELWSWLEERSGIPLVGTAEADVGKESTTQEFSKKTVKRPSAKRRDIDEAIEATEQRLAALYAAKDKLQGAKKKADSRQAMES